MLANNASDKGLISKIHKKLTRLNTNTKPTIQLKMGRGPELAFLQSRPIDREQADSCHRGGGWRDK